MRLLICCLIFYLFQSTSTKQLTVCRPINFQDQLEQTGEKRSSNSSIYFEETFLEKGGKGENGTQGFKGSKGNKGETGRLEEITKNEMYLKIQEYNQTREDYWKKLNEDLVNINQELSEFKACSTNPCINGECSYNSSNNNYQCQCKPGFLGKNCQTGLACHTASQFGFNKNDVYNITIPGRSSLKQVYCDLETDGGGWLVFQRRLDGSVDFFQWWDDYVNGFGNLSGEFWLGLDLLHIITTSQSYMLRVNLEDWEGNTSYAIYKNFSVESLQTQYRLNAGGYNGTAGDSFSFHNNQSFFTRDAYDVPNCVNYFHGCYWYNNCAYSNLNGKYYANGQIKSDGVFWTDWTNNYYSLKRVEMKIRPK